MFQTRELAATACVPNVLALPPVLYLNKDETYHSEQIRIPVEADDAEGIEPLPESVHLLGSR